MSQGQWRCTKEGAESPNIDTIAKTEEDGTTTSVTTGMSGPLYPSALNVFEDSSRSNQPHWSLPIG